jgi:hypothetical protein
MKEELNVVGNEYQTFTTMWTMSVPLPYLITPTNMEQRIRRLPDPLPNDLHPR